MAEGPIVAATANPPAWAALPDDGVGNLSDQASVDWKVVYVVGYVGSGTEAYIEEAEANAEAMRALGATVVLFYPPRNEWNDIVAAAADATVLVYAGHGVSWDTIPTVGGMSLSSSSKVTPDQIRSDLRMAPGGVVILNHVCFASGGSSTDPGAISSTEAQRRVAQYSDPFLAAGLVGCYSSWYGSFPAKVVSYLASGMTLGEAYEAYADYREASVERYTHPSHPEFAMWMDKDTWGSVIYNYAFVGGKDLSLLSASGSESAIGIGREWIEMRSEPGAGSSSYTFTVAVTDGLQVAWTAWLDGGASSWLSISPTSGNGTGSLRLTVTAPALAGTYTTNLHVHASDARVGEPDAVIPITLVVEAPLQYSAVVPLVSGQ